MDLQEFDPVCPTCHAPWAGIERLVTAVRFKEQTDKLNTVLLDALRTLVAAAAEFLELVDEAYDLDDPESPCHRTADALEDALMLARRVLGD